MARKKKTKSKTETVETVETVNVNVNVEEGNTVNIEEGNTVSLGDVFVDVDENTVVLSDVIEQDITEDVFDPLLDADLSMDFYPLPDGEADAEPVTAAVPPPAPKAPEPPKERSLAKPARAGFWNPNRLKDK